MGFNVGVVAAFAAAARGTSGALDGLPLLEAASRDLLGWFLVSNLSCGAANLAVDTMRFAADDWRVVAVLAGRAAVDAAVLRASPVTASGKVKRPS